MTPDLNPVLVNTYPSNPSRKSCSARAMYVTFDQTLCASLCALTRQVPGIGELSGDIGISAVASPSRLKPPSPMVAFGEGQMRLSPLRSRLVSSVYRAPTVKRVVSAACQVI